MKKCILALMLLCGMMIVAKGAEISETSANILKQYGVTFRAAVADIPAAMAKLAEIESDIKTNGTAMQKYQFVRLKTLGTIYGKEVKVADTFKMFNENRKAIGMYQAVYDYQFYFFIKVNNPGTTDANIAEGKQIFNALTPNQQSQCVSQYARFLYFDGDKEEAFNLIKKSSGRNKLNTFKNLCNLEGTDVAKQEYAKMYISEAIRGKVDGKNLDDIDEVLNTLMTADDFDAAKLKKQLNVVRITYINRMSDDAGKKQYGKFVSIIVNTYNNL